MRPPSTRPRAFTLIELLVVIAIIAILLGLAVPSLFTIYERAKKTQAKNDLTQIVNAVNAFYTDYGKYPTCLATDATATYGPAGSNTNDLLFNELRATSLTNPLCPNSTAINTRQIVFISPRVLGTTPARSGIGSDGQFYDPWQTPYNVRIDADYNNSTLNPYGAQAVGGAGADPIQQGVIAWSYGIDKQQGTNGNNVYKNPVTGAQSDDVISWQ